MAWIAVFFRDSVHNRWNQQRIELPPVIEDEEIFHIDMVQEIIRDLLPMLPHWREATLYKIGTLKRNPPFHSAYFRNATGELEVRFAVVDAEGSESWMRELAVKDVDRCLRTAPPAMRSGIKNYFLRPEHGARKLLNFWKLLLDPKSPLREFVSERYG